MKILNRIFGKKSPQTNTTSEDTHRHNPQKQPLKAIYNKNYEEVYRLLSSGVSPNFFKSQGCDDQGAPDIICPMKAAKKTGSKQMKHLLRQFGAITAREHEEFERQKRNRIMRETREKKKKRLKKSSIN